MFADEPSLLPEQMSLTLVPNPLRWSVGDPHANSSKTSLLLDVTVKGNEPVSPEKPEVDSGDKVTGGLDDLVKHRAAAAVQG
jgi:hypothetical protein